MILVDSSVWIAYLRGEETSTAVAMLVIEADTGLAVTEPIAMELLAGADTDARAATIDRLVNGLVHISIDPRLDFYQAARIFRAVCRSGRRPRSMVDCLIAAIATRRGVELAPS